MKKYKIVIDGVTVFKLSTGDFSRTLEKGDTIEVSKIWNGRTQVGKDCTFAQISPHEFIILELHGRVAAEEIKERKKKEAKS